MASSGQDVIYSFKRAKDSESAIKIGQLKELILALDELALETDSGRYSHWIYSDVRDLYTILRATFEQLVSGQAIQVSRQELLDKVHNIRSGIGEYRLREQLESSRAEFPRREPRLTTLISHCTGAEYCKNVFHTQRHRGRLVHTPGPPNPPAESVRDHESRRWLMETSSLSSNRPKSAKRKKAVNLELILLKDRARNLEQQLQSELRRELRSEQAVAHLREEDRYGFDQIVNKLDYLAEILKCSGRPARSETPPPSPPPKREIIVDKNRIDQLELELSSTRSRLSKELADREERMSVLVQEINKQRLQVDDLRKIKSQLESELALLKASESNDKKLLEDKIERLEATIKDLTRSERRLSKRETRLKEDKSDLENRISELENELSRLRKVEAELQAKMANLQDALAAKNIPVPVSKPLIDVVSKVLYRYYLYKFRKESKVRSELQSTLEMTVNAAERARKLSEYELNSTRSNLNAELEALRQELELKNSVNKHLQDQAENLEKDREDLERRLTTTMENDRCKSLDEIAHLQTQLIQIKAEPKSEPIVTDMEPFKKMLMDSFHGDYLHLEDNPSVLHVMFSQGDERVLFSDRIEKLNHRNFKEKRILVISHNALYLLLPKAWELKRVVKIEDIDKITMSRRSADHLCIHHRSEEDLFFISSKRYEIMHFMMNAFQLKTSASIPYHFAERFYVEDRDMHYRLVEVPDTTTVKLGRSVLLGPT